MHSAIPLGGHEVYQKFGESASETRQKPAKGKLRRNKQILCLQQDNAGGGCEGRYTCALLYATLRNMRVTGGILVVT